LKTRRNCQGFWEQIKAFDSLPSHLWKAARSYRSVRGEAEEEYGRKAETDLIIGSSGKGPGHSTPRNDFPGPTGERILYSTTFYKG
jgi:hypothetical protein